MAPSNNSPKEGPRSNCSLRSVPGDAWPPDEAVPKDHQRPPVFNPEDYAMSLRTWGRRPSASSSPLYVMSCPSTPEVARQNEFIRSQTLPSKQKDYRSPITAPPPAESEMKLRQFGSVSELLSRLRADLRESYLSFVQEFVGAPLEGVSLLLEVLRAVQLSHSGAISKPQPSQQHLRVSPAMQRRALLDELTCLQCLQLCCSRSSDAANRLGVSPCGLLPLAASATGPTVRARLLGLRLLAASCSSEGSNSGGRGHGAVDEALSTLRLQCGEPVRFRLLIGMLQSGGGNGELQATGMEFINSFIETSNSIQQRLYLQSELHQAGLEPQLLLKNSANGQWAERLQHAVKRWERGYIDVVRLQERALAGEREGAALRGRVSTLERRIKALQQDKEDLQKLCRQLQQNSVSIGQTMSFSNNAYVEKLAVSPKRRVSNHEDEGISSSEAERSLSPDRRPGAASNEAAMKQSNTNATDEDEEATIEQVIEELHNIVSDAERNPSWGTTKENSECSRIYKENNMNKPATECPSFSRITILYEGITASDELKVSTNTLQPQTEEIPEAEIVPACILPNPPRKTRPDRYRNRHPTELFFDADALMDDISDGTSDSLLSASRCLPIHNFYKETKSHASEHSHRHSNRDSRRRSKSVDSIVLDGLDGMVDIVLTSEESAAHPMFLDTSRRTGGFVFKRQSMNAGLYSDTTINAKHGSSTKIMDLPSGLY